MANQPRDVVTGAFSFTGRYVAERLLTENRQVVTLTNHPDRNVAFADRVHVEPYRFHDIDVLAESLAGAETLYNTFWMRTSEDGPVADTVVECSRRLVTAAEIAGIPRIVHFSVSHATESELSYYRAKAAVEGIVEDSELTHAILRPTFIFGRKDVFFNNLAWFLRRFPVFVVHGTGEYRVQPVFVGDVAAIAVEYGARTDSVTVDVAGPDVYRFDALLREFADALGVRCKLIRVPSPLAHLAVKALELVLRDVLMTWEEAQGLMDELLVTETPPRGETAFGRWAAANAEELGRSYTSFRDRHR